MARRERTGRVKRHNDINPKRDQNGKIDPVVAVRELHRRRGGNEAMFAVLNTSYAVVRYGGEIVIANIIRNDVILMKVENFHKMYANVRVRMGLDLVEVSKVWFRWRGRRQYFHRGIVFEPGGPLDAPDDMINLWRGFGIKPKQGDWSPLRNHLLNVVCSGNQTHFDYLIRWMAYTVQRPESAYWRRNCITWRSGRRQGHCRPHVR